MAFIQKVIHDLLYVHPLHTMVVHFPIALTAAALFFILLALWRKSDILEQIAFANIALASVSTIVAAITGIRDNINLYGGQAPNHVAKIVLGSTLFVVTAVTALVRWRKKDLFHGRAGKALYVAAYFVSFSLAAVLGFLGGVILYGF
jgi:uncharacterized membrane protein